jgi:erythronate-4-phosphate dehydrogenase
VLAAVCALVADMGLARADWTVGVIGYGHVGADVAALFEALGARCLVNDPPRAALFGDREYVSLQQALRADVVTLHTPLTDSGPHSTRHLIKAEQLARLRAGAVLINAARGGVIDETALLDTLAARDDLRVALDCWCNEPAIDLRLLERVAIATPHIAGHTAQAKQRGTQALYEAFRRFVAGGARDQEIAERRAGGTPPLGRSFSPSSVISHFDIRAETARLRAMARTDDIATHFDRCRAAHLRHEFLPISDQPAALSYTGALAGDS